MGTYPLPRERKELGKLIIAETCLIRNEPFIFFIEVKLSFS